MSVTLLRPGISNLVDALAVRNHGTPRDPKGISSRIAVYSRLTPTSNTDYCDSFRTGLWEKTPWATEPPSINYWKKRLFESIKKRRQIVLDPPYHGRLLVVLLFMVKWLQYGTRDLPSSSTL
jgi:hypothetical protein